MVYMWHQSDVEVVWCICGTKVRQTLISRKQSSPCQSKQHLLHVSNLTFATIVASPKRFHGSFSIVSLNMNDR